MANTAETDMPYVRLGKSGLKVSKLILGCMGYGSPEWEPWVLGEAEGLEQIKAAYDLGINAFDTADVYSNGLSEVILGKAIKKFNLPREEIVVMTKVWGTVGRAGAPSMLFLASQEDLSKQRYTNQQGLSRKHIFDGVKKSLERLQLDYIDLLQCHRFDYNTPIEETMQALHDVVKEGYVRYIGMSSCYAWQCEDPLFPSSTSFGSLTYSSPVHLAVHKMQNYAREHGLTSFISMQNFYNAIYREEEREMVPLLQDLGVGMIPWSPLARGFLTRSIKVETERGKLDQTWSKLVNGDPDQDTFLVEINNRVSEIAKSKGVSMAQVAIAWALSKEFVTAPIIGTSSVEKLKDLVGGVHLKLTEEEISAIDKSYKARGISGKEKSPHHQNGVVHITTHRLFYIDLLNPQAYSLALNLSNVRHTEFYTGFLSSSSKVTLVLGPPGDSGGGDDDEPAPESTSPATSATTVTQPTTTSTSASGQQSSTRFFIEAWICPICSFSNPPSANEGRPKCQLCGVTRDPAAVPAARPAVPQPVLLAPTPIRPLSAMNVQDSPNSPVDAQPSATVNEGGSVACPACTFLNHVSMRLCEMCSTPLRAPRQQQSTATSSRAEAATGPTGDSARTSGGGSDPSTSTYGAVSRATTPAPGSEVIKISFRKGGDKVWYAVLKKTLLGKAWEGSPLDRQTQSATAGGSPSKSANVYSGIHGIMQAAESTARVENEALSVSLRDLEALMAKAKQMVQIAQTLNEKLTAQEEAQRALSPGPSSRATATTTVPEEATFIRSSMARLGLPSTAVTQDMVKDENQYIEGLAKELAGILTGSGRTSAGGGLMGEHNGIMGLDEVWCAWNRARGISLLPPSTLISVAPLLHLFTSPSIHQRTFKKSGVSVLHIPKYAHDAFSIRFLHMISETETGGGLGALSSVEVAREEGMSVGLAEEMIGAVEDDGEVLRDELVGYEPVRWYTASQFRTLLVAKNGMQ
ncbi:hypothetical protein FRC04_003198 [Tulasnella sp. 424]|nr:hypothetical protein FRC04_003198 [Tulasnella sp. 424]KAG8966216.1 hypothetical protein FRC05_002755 [Tulasnella sp. 425]